MSAWHETTELSSYVVHCVQNNEGWKLLHRNISPVVYQTLYFFAFFNLNIQYDIFSLFYKSVNVSA
jgi:hypothetical protein